MTKVSFKPGTMIYPVPAVMVSCGTTPEEYNIITIAWTGILNTNPPMCHISVRPERHSYNIIKKSGEFVINLTTKNLAFATDWCGVKSGRKVDKFKEMNLTPTKSEIITTPVIGESPVNIECVVREIKDLGTHHLFISEIVNVQVDENILDKNTDALRLDTANLIAYCHGFYYTLGEKIGKFGYSVMKSKTTKKRKPKSQ